MVENDPVLEQRVEALEQFSQTRVVEQVGDLTQRVSGLESARETEKPHLASKEDIARLEGLHSATQKQIAAQSEQFSKDLQAQSELFNARLDSQSEQFNKDLQAQSEQFNARLVSLSAQFSKDLIAQSEQFSKDQKAQTEQLRRELEQRINRLVAWAVVTGIALGGLIIATST